MTVPVSETQSIHKDAFLDLFPPDCRENCIVARIAAASAIRQMVELDLTFQKASEIYAHRFGRCALGPTVEGRCGKKSICSNDLVEGIEDPIEAAAVLTII